MMKSSLFSKPKISDCCRNLPKKIVYYFGFQLCQKFFEHILVSMSPIYSTRIRSKKSDSSGFFLLDCLILKKKILFKIIQISALVANQKKSDDPVHLIAQTRRETAHGHFEHLLDRHILFELVNAIRINIILEQFQVQNQYRRQLGQTHLAIGLKKLFLGRVFV